MYAVDNCWVRCRRVSRSESVDNALVQARGVLFLGARAAVAREVEQALALNLLLNLLWEAGNAAGYFRLFCSPLASPLALNVGRFACLFSSQLAGPMLRFTLPVLNCVYHSD